MNPTTSGGVFDDTDRTALKKAACTSSEVWALGIFAERFSKEGRKSLAQIFIQGREKGIPFADIMEQCQQSWSDVLTFSSQNDLHGPEHKTWGTANKWAYNHVRKTLRIEAPTVFS